MLAASCAALCALLLATCASLRLPEGADAAQLVPQKWYTVPGGAGTMAADGSAFYFFAKRGRSDKLLIYFDGGGVAWDEASAAKPITLGLFLSGGGIGNYFQSIPSTKLRSIGGLMLANDPKNPFDDWNFVFIPYATGDFHTGNGSIDLRRADGSSYRVRFNGRKNVLAALDWAYRAFPNPSKLFVAGGSAGAFGSSIWLGTIADHYPDARVYHLADGAYLYKPEWPSIADELWKADWQNSFGFAPDADLVGAAMRYNAAHLAGRASILQSHSLRDGTLSLFQARITGASTEAPGALEAWSSRAMAAVKALSTSIPNYNYFITDGGADSSGATPHTYSLDSGFYSASQDGTSYARWVDDAVNGDKAYSVGGEFLPQ